MIAFVLATSKIPTATVYGNYPPGRIEHRASTGAATEFNGALEVRKTKKWVLRLRHVSQEASLEVVAANFWYLIGHIEIEGGILRISVRDDAFTSLRKFR